MASQQRVRKLGARLFWSLRLGRAGRVAADQLTIITFHRILPDPDDSPLPHLAVTPKLLRGCLDYFAHHYTCLTVSEAATRFFAGDRPAKPLLAVSFNDGRKDGFLHGLSALRASHVPATFYVPAGRVDDTNSLWHDELARIVRQIEEHDATEFVREQIPTLDGAGLVRAVIQHAMTLSERKRDSLITRLREQAGQLTLPFWEQPMGWSDLQLLIQEGHEIGSHSMSHGVLREDLGSDPHREIAESRRLLEEKLKGPVTSFCYPTGEHDDATLRELKRAGYQNAVTTGQGLNDGAADHFGLRRFDVQEQLNSNRHGEADQALLAWNLSRLPGAPR
ncbi:MAG: polysaccharide deacetylase family protein [bacterium]|nr:polysaccharide deacetylase family protein [bacterium]